MKAGSFPTQNGSLMAFIVAALLAMAPVAVRGQILFTTGYSQDFDSMGSTGPTGTYPEGWSGVKWAGSTNVGIALSLTNSNGGSISGSMYNVGTTGESDRAMGTLASGSTSPRFGAQFSNASGSTIDELSFAFTEEQWRSGSSAAVNEVVTFAYSLNATGINDSSATWVTVSGLDLVEILTSTTGAAAVNGNDPANQLSRSASLSGLGWLDSQTLTIRWSDVDHTGSDGMYAVDNFSVTAVPEPAAWAVVAGLGLLAFAIVRRKRAAQSA